MNFKQLGFVDIGAIKLSVLFGALFLVSIWQGFADWAQATHWAWFLGASILLAIKPLLAVCKE